ncbi:hypothetical protein Y032_0077g1136 [Ancylostoma ceylanicum]|uniref:EF-hand domain-containing protein n=1 Tax=Ancylostoma ceylanicum TaxID=53326 RepID=A0A016TU69_9BILA|nr:hypothetical protein Y032_0077g1136 [Ancylostoma ceylanicum]
MPPSTSLFPGCCCAKSVKKPKNEPKEELSVAVKPVKTKQHLVIPKVALNGRIISSVKRRVDKAPEHVAIEMPEEFVTARTSRDSNSDHYLTMKELMRVVRIEEGLKVTPRDRHHLGQGPSTSKPVTVDDCICPPTASPQRPLRLDATQLAHRERARKAVFDAEGDITTRSSSSRSPPKTGFRRHSLCSVATISGDQHLVLPQPPPPPTQPTYMTYVPQMILAMLTISFAWLANLITYVYR